MKNRRMSAFLKSFLLLGLFFSLGACELSRLLDAEDQNGTSTVYFSEPTNDQVVSRSFAVSGSVYDANPVQSMVVYVTPTNGGQTNSAVAALDGGRLKVFHADVNLAADGVFYLFSKTVNTVGGETMTAPFVVVVDNSISPTNSGTNTNTNNTTNYTDTIEPEVAITSHTNLQAVGSTYELSGTATDIGSGVAAVYASIDDGAFSEITYSSGNWSENYTVGEGSHTNRVYATDLSNNVSFTNRVIVVYEAGLPFIGIDSPENNALVGSLSLPVTGTASVDGSTISAIEMSVNGAAYTSVGVAASWATNVALSEGTNTVQAQVISAENKTNSSSLVTVIADTLAPTFTFDSPSDGDTVSNTTVTFSGTAFDSATGIEGVYMAIDDDVYANISTSSNWSSTVSLPLGSHTISAFAMDSAGHSSQTNEITITISDAFIVYLKLPSGWSAPPYIHYWEGDCGSTTWPGDAMTIAPEEGDDWYSFSFEGSSTSIVFNDGSGNQTGDLSRDRKGWYKSGVWYDRNPEGPQDPEITASPAEGTYTSNITVTLNSANGPADTIYYTTDGGTPTTGSPHGSSPVTIGLTTGTHVIQAFGINELNETGDTESFTYTIDPDADLIAPYLSNNVEVGHHDGASLGVSFTVYDNKSDTVTVYYTDDYSAATTGSAVYVSGNAISGLSGSVINITETTSFNFLVVDAAGNETNLTYYYHLGEHEAKRLDPRQETIYFLLTSRWYDGYAGNSIGDEWCSYTEERYAAGGGFTGPEDVAWRGDFQGLVEKMDYIKALGFTTIWITPVVQNRSPLCYHGYHAWDMYSEDDRLESPGYDFQRVIDEAHQRDMKICLDIVINHSGRFGLKDFAEVKYNTDPNLYPDPDVWTPDWEYDGLTSPGTLDGEDMPPYVRVSDVRSFDANDLANYPYLATDMANGFLKYQWPSTESYCKTIDGVWDDGGAPGSLDYNGYCNSARLLRGHNTGFPTGSGSFDNFPDAHFDSCHEDCPDLNIENSDVQDYIIGAYNRYIDMGVDMFRVDTVMHMHRETLNDVYWPAFLTEAASSGPTAARGGAEFFIFGEVANFVNSLFDKPMQLRQNYYTWDNSYGSMDTSYNHLMDGNNFRTLDYSRKAPGASYTGHVSVIDLVSHNGFADGYGNAYGRALGSDQYYNDATYLTWYTDSHDYGPNKGETRWTGDFASAWSMLFTFRGIPIVYYGSEIRFAQGLPNDWPGGGSSGTEMSLENTGRSYFGDYLEGSVTATDFGEYTASGTVKDTLDNGVYCGHLRNLNKIRLAVPALQMGQYSTDGGSGGWANYKRRYDGEYYNNASGTIETISSYCLVGVGSGSHSFSGVLDGSYYDIVTGNSYTASGGYVSFNVSGNDAGLGVLVYTGSGFYTGDLTAVHNSIESTSYFGN